MTQNSSDKIPNPAPRIFEFAEFSFDAAKKLLWRNGETVPLAPKACEILAVLIEHAPQVVSKDELMNQVWNDSFVEEANLTQHISALRKTLGEDKAGRKFIETIPRKGYRFVAQVKNGTHPESAEIVISERAAVRSVEETIIENGYLTAQNETISISKSDNVALPQTIRTNRKISRSVLTAAVGLIILIGGAAAFFGYRHFYAAQNSPAAPNEISFKRLTADADVSAPSISPDGASVVFVKNENERQSLWRKQIVSAEVKQLTPAVSMLDVGIFSTRFSPDGRWIYFAQYASKDTEQSQTLYRIPADGGAAQKILTDLTPEVDFSISPDGKQIAYTYDWRQLIVADIETGSKRVVIDWDGVNKVVYTDYCSSAAWSPDGSRLIFAGSLFQDDRNVQKLFEINLVTGAERQIPLPATFFVRQIEWLADDGGLIVTQSDRLKDKICRVDPQSGAMKRLSNETDSFRHLRVSADAKTLIAEQVFGQFNIWTASADHFDQRRQITTGAAAMQGVIGLTQLPDGKIVYISTESGASDIWTMNADGGDRRQLTFDTGHLNQILKTTKDGRYIVFSSTRSGSGQTWRMDADGKNPVQLSRAVESFDFEITPENEVEYITYSADEQKYQLYKVSLDGGEPTRVDDYYSVTMPRFSPDGKWILFFGGITKDDKPRVGIIERASGKVVRYFDNSFTARGWMPDSKSIVDTRANGQELWRQPIDGGAAIKLFDFSPLKLANWNFSADGKRIVLSLGNSTSEAVLIQNFSQSAESQ